MHNEVLEGLIVVKRSGQRVDFNASKIAIAIKKAFDSVSHTTIMFMFQNLKAQTHKHKLIASMYSNFTIKIDIRKYPD